MTNRIITAVAAIAAFEKTLEFDLTLTEPVEYIENSNKLRFSGTDCAVRFGLYLEGNEM